MKIYGGTLCNLYNYTLMKDEMSFPQF